MPPVSNAEGATLFDGFVESYEDACGRGLALSGESRDYFARQRVAVTRSLCGQATVSHIIDFGCGLGHTTPYFHESFADATLIGLDTSAGAIASARSQYGGPKVSFSSSDAYRDEATANLVYTNGTFHHIEPRDRDAEVSRIFRWLEAGGLFALWENNPWNPGTRLVMRRIPFDRDAQTLSPPEATRMVRRAGFDIVGVTSYFYFPSWLKPLRIFERSLRRVPLGAQYCVLARKPAAHP